MIYRNVRPWPITIENKIYGTKYVVESQGLTPDLPEIVARDYRGTLVEVPSAMPRVIPTVKVSRHDGELFEQNSSVIPNELFEMIADKPVESGEEQVLNETKRGRGRPKKTA